MQLDPVKPTLKAPGTKRLKLKSDEPLSSFAFEFKLRRYSKVYGQLWSLIVDAKTRRRRPDGSILTEAGAYTRSLFGST